ncbi:MAG: EamA family transporter [Rhizobiales bacterium]|nr:EamA family transporter [Hyphomicrobiales bacterium]
MDPFVFAAVLVGAACHAGWNALVKVRLEPFTAMALIAICSFVIVIPIVPFVGLPAPAAWPWIGASILVHIGYFIGLSEAYRYGDMGQVYPIARGSAPLMTTLVSTTVLGEAISPMGIFGIVLLACGVFVMSFRGGAAMSRMNSRAVGFALFTAVTICGYSISDGTGARVSGNPHAYTVWLFIADGLMMTMLVLIRRGPASFPQMAPFWISGFIGGVLSLAAYWIAIWAMTKAPIAIVAALRETSVLFAAAIAVFILKEPLSATRIAAAVLIVAGLALIRLQ